MAAQKVFNLSNKVLEYLFYILFAITPLIFTPYTSELFETPKMFFVYFLTVLIVFCWATKSILAGRVVFRRTILDIPLFLFLLSLTISTITSVDVHTSIWGWYGRFNGSLLSAICYCLLYWSYVSNMTPKTTLTSLKSLIISATIIAIYAILEHFGHSYSCLVLKGKFDVSCWAPKVQERVFATLGQPNWLAAWLVGVIPLSWAYVLKTKPTSRSPVIGLLSYCVTGLLFAAIFFTHSRSGYIGLAAALAVFVFFLLPKKWPLRLTYIFLTLLVGIFLWQRVLADCFDLNPNTLVTSAGTESCKIRAIVWKGAIDIWKHYPVFGSGVETFGLTYYNFRPVEHNLTSEWDLLYNKAHNEYLNYLATTGIVGLSTYLLLIGTFLVWSLRNLPKHPNLTNPPYLLAILAGYASILVTNLPGFSVVTTSLLFFLLPAMSISFTSFTSPNSPKLSLTPTKNLISFLAFCFLLFALFKIAGYFEVDQLYASAKKQNSQGSPKTAIKDLKTAIELSPNEPKYYDELADSVSQASVIFAEDHKTDDAVKFAQLSKDLSDRAVTLSPRNVSLWSSRSVYLKRLTEIDQKYLNFAISSLEEAVRLAPTDPTFRYNLGVLYAKNGDNKKAKETLKEALELKPNYPEASDALNQLSP